MSEQPESLPARLARRLCNGISTGHDWPNTDDELLRLQSASELRRLHTENEALRAQIGQGVPDVADLIAGALYDFLGHLTSMEKSIAFGATEWATPAVDALLSFAEKRRLTLNNPAIESWYDSLASAPPAPQQKPHTA